MGKAVSEEHIENGGLSTRPSVVYFMFNGKGILHYSNTWLTLQLDDEIGRYYRAIINREHPSIKLNAPMHGSHITIISGKYETPPNKLEYWGLYEGEIVSFTYSPELHFDGTYFWLTVDCLRIEEIRKELGLPHRSCTDLRPWHTTIGNTKGLE